jgi:hypothetical protein
MTVIYLGKVYTTKKNRETLLYASKKAGHELNAEKTKYTYMFIPCHKSVEQNHNTSTQILGMRVANKIVFTREDYIQGMLPTIQFGIIFTSPT